VGFSLFSKNVIPYCRFPFNIKMQNQSVQLSYCGGQCHTSEVGSTDPKHL